MLKIEDTGIEEISFGDQPDDLFYILVNKKIRPNGINVDGLTKAEPQHFNVALQNEGCLILLNHEEATELVRRGELDFDNFHQSLFELAKKEGLLW